MILLIDVGNTCLKWQCLTGHELMSGGQMMHEGSLTLELLEQEWCLMEPPESVWAVSVASVQVSDLISRWVDGRWGVVINFITASKKLGNVTNGYFEPERLGADRWMALVGADAIMQGACCVADCGTAVTIDVMNINHEHLGGLIIPGLTMMPRCVSNNTACVKFSEGDVALLGRDTSACLASGAIQSIAGTLQRVADLMSRQLPSPVTRIITGGDAPHLLPWLDREWRYEPNLIFYGLAAAMHHSQG